MIAAALFALVLSAPPAPIEDPEVKTAVEEYRRGDYQAARTRLQKATRRETLPKHERVRAHLHIGFCEVAFGNRTAAKVEFKQSLLLDPALTLDPAQVSPKIIDVFEEAKREMPPIPTPTPVVAATPKATPTPVAKATPAPVARISPRDAAVRSLAVPGWGQYSEGRTPAAATFAAAEVAALGFTVWNQMQVGVARKNVDRAQDPQKDEMRRELAKFEGYRNASVAAIVAVTASAATDAWLGAKRRPRIAVVPAEDGAAVAMSIRF